jgi:hypothetical protein
MLLIAVLRRDCPRMERPVAASTSAPSAGAGDERREPSRKFSGRGRGPEPGPSNTAAPSEIGARGRPQHPRSTSQIFGGGVGDGVQPERRSRAVINDGPVRASDELLPARAGPETKRWCQGELNVRVSVAASGRVGSVSISGPAAFFAPWQPCLRRAINKWDLPHGRPEA